MGIKSRKRKVMRNGSPHYTDTERLGLMFLALRDGVPETCQRTGIPATTLHTWFQRFSGDTLGAVRAFLNEETEGDYLRAIRAFYAEGIKRAPTLSDKLVVDTLHRLVEGRKGQPSPVSITLSQQQAQIGLPHGDLSEAERAYLSALRGESSVEGGQDATLAALPLPSDDSE